MVYHHVEMTDTDLYNNRILIVDDGANNRELVTNYLKGAGYQHVTTAVDSSEALRKVSDFDPNLIILDLLMSNREGIHLIKELRSDYRTKQLPIIVQTTVRTHEERNEAWRSGATDVIMKPTHRLELLARVRIQLEHAAMVQKLESYQKVADDEIAKALDLQISLLPSQEQILFLEEKYGLSIRSLYLPCRFLSGDMWGMYEVTDNKVLVWICDFSGKGIGASLHTLRVHTLISELKDITDDPKEMMTRLNDRLVHMVKIGNFCTCLMGIIDFEKKSFDYISASSTHPFIYHPATQNFTLGDGAGMPLGIDKKVIFEERSLPFSAGDSLVLYSDLMWEDEGAVPGISFLPEDLPSFLKELEGRRVIDVVREKIGSLDDAHFSDDLTLVEIVF